MSQPRLPDPNRSIEAQDEGVLLAMCIWGEARGECEAARLGVANVVANRVRRCRYGAGWRGVILRKWAFSSFNPADPNRSKLLHPLDHDAAGVWEACFAVAASVLAGGASDNTSGATHYFDDSLAAHPPAWARSPLMHPTVKIGRLNFYGELPPAPARRLAA